MQNAPGLDARDCVLHITTPSFDMAVPEFYLPLTVGAKIIIASRETARDAILLANALEHFDVTLLQATPASWRLLLSANWAGRPNLKAMCGGEALSKELAVQLQSRVSELWNMYGPTETTVWSTCGHVAEIDGSQFPSESICCTAATCLSWKSRLVSSYFANYNPVFGRYE